MVMSVMLCFILFACCKHIAALRVVTALLPQSMSLLLPANVLGVRLKTLCWNSGNIVPAELLFPASLGCAKCGLQCQSLPGPDLQKHMVEHFGGHDFSAPSV